MSARLHRAASQNIAIFLNASCFEEVEVVCLESDEERKESQDSRGSEADTARM
jgi:hypothetical protein